MRKMEWCFSTNFSNYIENYLRLDGERRQLPAPVFNSRYAIDLLHKLVDDILFFCFLFKLFFRFYFILFFSLTPLHLFMRRTPMSTISIGATTNSQIHRYN